MQEILNKMEPRLMNLQHLLSSLRCHSVMQCRLLEDRVSESGRLVIIGTAARPMPPKSIQESAVAVEDGAVLAHNSQLQRGAAVVESETKIMYFTCMPDGEDQWARDEGMRAKLAAGVEVLHADADEIETPEWREVKENFGYDAEDEADNWWMSWGSLQLRSLGVRIHSIETSTNDRE
ncbi:hypothetical protein B0H11DRAFT_2046921, partial [Mycena galericulata]